MTALSDALGAAQARAVAALAKAYVNSPLEAADLEVEKDRIRGIMTAVGLTDHVGQAQWLAALDVIRGTGSQAPAEARPAQVSDDKASDAQWKLIRKLADERGAVAPAGPLTREQASTVINQLKAGAYSPDDWGAPF